MVAPTMATSTVPSFVNVIYEGVQNAESLLTALNGFCYESNETAALYGLEYLNTGLDYICTYVDCAYFADHGLSVDEYNHLCQVVDDSCYWGDELDIWVDLIANGHEWDPTYCYNYLYAFEELQDDLLESLCLYFTCELADLDEDQLLYNVSTRV
jgi:hypothetical protein